MVWVSVYFTTDLIQTGVDLRRTIFRMKVAFGIFVKFLTPSLKPQTWKYWNPLPQHCAAQ